MASFSFCFSQKILKQVFCLSSFNIPLPLLRTATRGATCSGGG